MVKIQHTTRAFVVTIPKAYIQQAGWKKGTEVTVSFNERGNIELAEVKKR